MLRHFIVHTQLALFFENFDQDRAIVFRQRYDSKEGIFRHRLLAVWIRHSHRTDVNNLTLMDRHRDCARDFRTVYELIHDSIDFLSELRAMRQTHEQEDKEK